MVSGVGLSLPLVRRQRPNRQCVNLVADQSAETLVHELMPRQGALALKFQRDHQRFEMGVVITENFNSGVFKSGLDQAAYFRWIHSR